MFIIRPTKLHYIELNFVGIHRLYHCRNKEKKYKK